MKLPAYESIRVELERGVGTVIIDRPPRNALVPTTMLEIRDALWRLDTNTTVRAAILTGAGEFFCSGADLSRPGLFDPVTGHVDREEMKRLRTAHREKLSLENRDPPELRIPVIAAINGSASGGGLTLALAADIRIVAADAKFNLAFVKRGFGPEHGMTWLLPRLVGQSIALELLLTGRGFDGAEAARIGLASRALPAAEVLPAAREMAFSIAENCAPLSVAVLKQMTWAHAGEPSYVKATRNEKDVIEWITAKEDAREGIRAYMEKRAPKWSSTGREELPGFVSTLFQRVVDDY